jgi:limonene-1,2-epoxide hydrolase
MTEPDVTTPTELVKSFLDAMGRLDAEEALGLLAEDVVYQNVSLPAARGKAAVGKQLRMFEKYLSGFEAINHRIVGDGNTVLTERTDIIQIGPFKASFWVCGTFEVRDGKITLWRDYFDWGNLLAGSAAGAGRAALDLVRSLRRG